ncbi:unnamed protein product, partial [Mesorhabditis spiculigera]
MRSAVLIFFCSLLVSALADQCADGYHWNGKLNTCVMPVQNYNTYQQSSDICTKAQGALFSVHDQNSNDALVGEARMYFIYTYYLGATRSGDSWKWIDGSAMDYTNWAPGQPSNAGNCLTADVFSHQWSVADCATEAQAFCGPMKK